MFWLVVPAIIADFISNEYMMSISPSIYMPGTLFGAVCSVVYGVILLKLSIAEDKYHTAGICVLISAAISLLIVIFSGKEEGSLLSLIALLPTLVVPLVGEYNEFKTRSIVLTDVDY